MQQSPAIPEAPDKPPVPPRTNARYRCILPGCPCSSDPARWQSHTRYLDNSNRIAGLATSTDLYKAILSHVTFCKEMLQLDNDAAWKAARSIFETTYELEHKRH